MDSRCSAIAQLDALVRCRAVLVLLRCLADAWCSGVRSSQLEVLKTSEVGAQEMLGPTEIWGEIVLPNLGHQHLGHDLVLPQPFVFGDIYYLGYAPKR